MEETNIERRDRMRSEADNFLDDGHHPLSAAQEDDIELSTPCTIGWAIKQMQHGESVQRDGWNGKGQYLRLQVPDQHSKMTLPYIYINTVRGDRVPWLASQTDILATDWQTV